MHATQHAEHGVVGQPREIVLAELLEAHALLVGGVVDKISGRFFEERHLDAVDFVKVDRAVVGRQPGDAVGGDPTLLGEALEADEQRIAGKG